ncbi:MAG TPA: hypothetical protein VF614_15805 [Chthoniobacteraceae bacterium]|jgi:hypothetical protein
MLSPKFILLVSKGLIRDQRARRLIMFYGVIAALVLLFAGSTLLDQWLREHVMLFLIYWGACAWLTILLMGLAVLDLLFVRSAARRERQRLQAEYLRRNPPEV